jgi:phosphinothricin acetyltransferase
LSTVFISIPLLLFTFVCFVGFVVNLLRRSGDNGSFPAAHAMIRLATLDDLPAIVSIYNEAVAIGFATADTTPVSVASRQGWFREHDPAQHPIYVWADAGSVRAWCSLSPYRPGRLALRFTAEISYYVKADAQRQGIASRLIRHALAEGETLQIKQLFAIVLERNSRSCSLLEKLGFERWGFLPGVADFAGQECGHAYYGQRLPWAGKTLSGNAAQLCPPPG